MARGRTMRNLVGGLLAALLTVSASFGPPTSALATAPAAGEDVCPEPNNTYESTCYLGPTAEVLGFLSNDGDIDIYRVEPLEFGVVVRASLLEEPFAYRLTLLDWRANVLAQTQPGAPALEAQLGPPGSYYIAVEQSAPGQVSATTPYHLASELKYPAGRPQVAYSATFRPGGSETDDFDTSSDDDADYEISQGRMYVKMKHGGSADDPAEAGQWLPLDEAPADFTLSLDVKQVDQSDSGFLIQFRSPYDADAETGYKLLISPSEQRLKLRAYSAEDDEVSNLSKWVTSEAIHPTGTNRIVVRCHGNNIIVNVNGAELVNVKDDSFRDGAIWFAAMAWSPQPTVATFSNILVTTP